MSGSAYSDLDRPPLNQAALRRALAVPGGLWTDLRLVTETGSTNADLAEAARAGVPEGYVLVAECQHMGRGRIGRAWQSPPRAGIAVSVLLRPDQPRPGLAPVPARRYGWLPLLAGVALVDAVRRVAAVDAVLKWPNDLLLDGRKGAGILAESVPDPADVSGSAVVVGIGLNTTLRAEELPHPQATSLALAGAACTDRDPLLRALLRGLATWYLRWRSAAGDPDGCGLGGAYRAYCATIGEAVRVTLPGDRTLNGVAEAVDADGRLVVRDSAQTAHVLAGGDVVHLRTA